MAENPEQTENDKILYITYNCTYNVEAKNFGATENENCLQYL